MESCRMRLKQKYETTQRLKTQKCSSCHHRDGFLLRIQTFSHRSSKHKTYLPSGRDQSCLNWSLLTFLKDFKIMKVFPSGGTLSHIDTASQNLQYSQIFPSSPQESISGSQIVIGGKIYCSESQSLCFVLHFLWHPSVVLIMWWIYQ